jgi:hypothetical protein
VDLRHAKTLDIRISRYILCNDADFPHSYIEVLLYLALPSRIPKSHVRLALARPDNLGLHNFLLHDDDRLILGDFAGSGLNELPPNNISAGVRYLNPLFDWEYPLERDDVFALGTVLYELDRVERLFDGRIDKEIGQFLRNKQFPDLSLMSSPLRQVIEKCWKPPDYKASNALIALSKYITLSFGRTNLYIESQPSFTIKTLLSGLLGLAVCAVLILTLTL